MARRFPATFKQQLGTIPKPKLEAPGTVRFSFKYLQVPGTDPFSVADKDSQYFRKLLDRVRHVSSLSVSDFVGKYEKELRNHAVDFKADNVSCPGFTCLAQNREEAEAKAFQFSISVNEHGRVIGFMVNDVFFAVYLDHGHKVYS